MNRSSRVMEAAMARMVLRTQVEIWADGFCSLYQAWLARSGVTRIIRLTGRETNMLSEVFTSTVLCTSSMRRESMPVTRWKGKKIQLRPGSSTRE